MKILMLTWEYPPRVVGGISRVVYDLSRTLLKDGHDVTVVTYKEGDAPDFEDDRGETAIRRRPAGDIWQGLYEPLLSDQVPSGAVCLRHSVKHVLTHRILYADFWLWQPPDRPALPAGYFWIREADIIDYGIPRLIEILLATLPAPSP